MEESATPPSTIRSVGVRYGIILSAISIVFFLVLTFAGVDQTQGAGRWVGLIFYLIVIYLAHKNYKEGGDGFMTYGQGMTITLWIGIVCSAIYSLFFYIYIKFIDSTFVEAIKTKAIEDMEAKGMAQDQIDQSMEIAGKFMTPEAMLLFGLIGGIIMIIICGLIVSAFTQNKNPQADF
jgi:hypothetical protein